MAGQYRKTFLLGGSRFVEDVVYFRSEDGFGPPIWGPRKALALQCGVPEKLWGSKLVIFRFWEVLGILLGVLGRSCNTLGGDLGGGSVRKGSILKAKKRPQSEFLRFIEAFLFSLCF